MRLGDIKDDAVMLTKKGFGTGVSVMAGVVGTDFVLSRLLVKNGAPIVPANLGPVAIAGLGVVGGLLLEHAPGIKTLGQWIDPKAFAAGAIGIAMAGYVGKFLSPVMNASSEVASSTPAATAGFGFGRAFSRSLAGLGNLPTRRALAGGRPLAGAPVTFKETTPRRQGVAGANVRFVPTNPLAGVLS